MMGLTGFTTLECLGLGAGGGGRSVSMDVGGPLLELEIPLGGGPMPPRLVAPSSVLWDCGVSPVSVMTCLCSHLVGVGLSG